MLAGLVGAQPLRLRGRLCPRPAANLSHPAGSRRFRRPALAAHATSSKGLGSQDGGEEVQGGGPKLRELQERLRRAQEKLAENKERQQALLPYIVAAPKRGVIGTSRYADTLRKRIVKASRDKTRCPVLIFGEVGLEKVNVCALIHFGSPQHAAPCVLLDCSKLADDASELFGKGERKGLLYWLPEDATLILKNVHKVGDRGGV